MFSLSAGLGPGHDVDWLAHVPSTDHKMLESWREQSALGLEAAGPMTPQNVPEIEEEEEMRGAGSWRFVLEAQERKNGGLSFRCIDMGSLPEPGLMLLCSDLNL